MKARLKFDVAEATTSTLILNLTNSAILACNLPSDVKLTEAQAAVLEISAEIDRRALINLNR